MNGKLVVLAAGFMTLHGAVAMVKPLDKPWLANGETLVCFGDSITAGKGYFMKPLTAALEAKGVRVVNAGVPGDKTPMALTRIGEVAAMKPDAVMIFFGANDSVIGRGRWRDEPKVEPTTFRDNLKWMIHYLRMKAGVKKFSIVAPTGRCEGEGISEFGSVCAAYQLAAREAADDMGAVLVPLDHAFESSFRASVPDAKGLVNTCDGVHFSDKGSQVAAETMLRTWNMK